MKRAKAKRAEHPPAPVNGAGIGLRETTAAPLDDKARPALTPGKAAATIEALSSALVVADANNFNLDRHNAYLHEMKLSAERAVSIYSAGIGKIAYALGGVDPRGPCTPEALVEEIVNRALVAIKKGKRR